MHHLIPEFPFVLSVIGKGAEPSAFAAAIGQTSDPVILSPGQAFDLPFAGEPGKALTAARELAHGSALDINIVPAINRRKQLLIADMDSTIITCECLDELADMAGVKPQVSAITERAMRGEIEFAPALRERVALLKGLPLENLARVYDERVRLSDGAKALVATMRKAGAITLLVSGGFTYFTERVAIAAGFHAHRANTLNDDGKVLLGTPGEPILGREAKLAALEDAVAKLHIGFADVLAVGDGANDLAMIERAGLGVAYHAKPLVAEKAAAEIKHGDLRGLLYLQGYADSEISESMD